MEQYKNFLFDFDKSYEELQANISDKNYSEAASIQGYLLGMIRAVQILSDSETNMDFVMEVRDRAILLD